MLVRCFGGFYYSLIVLYTYYILNNILIYIMWFHFPVERCKMQEAVAKGGEKSSKSVP